METLSPERLRQYKYFSGISEGALEEFSRKLQIIELPVGSQIVKQGTPPDAFYFVRQGEVEVTKETKAGQTAKIAVMSSGEGFGEVALLTCSHRCCTVTAKSAVTLYKLQKTDFEDIIMKDSAFTSILLKKIKDYSQFNKMKTLQPFALLEPEKMLALTDKFIEETYGYGENIIVQGEKGNYYYVIRSGSVAVLKKEEDGEEYTQVAVLGEGEAFGEEALIRDDPRNATCQAIDETTVLALNKKDFDRIVKSEFLENIFPEDISINTYLDDFVVIDARVPAEYEEEHIAGAINIPLEVLRRQCAGLDRSKQYITYCLNDARGMVAAFLLRNRGFSAKCLRGGISGWTGEIETGSDGIHLPDVSG